MNSLAAAHDAAVQMIDTSIVRVHQHAACIARNRSQSMGRSRGGLTSKIHAVVDANGLPVRLGPTADEAHDNRLALSMVEVFPTHIRCSALSFAYSISLSVFGGTAPIGGSVYAFSIPKMTYTPAYSSRWELQSFPSWRQSISLREASRIATS